MSHDKTFHPMMVVGVTVVAVVTKLCEEGDAGARMP